MILAEDAVQRREFETALQLLNQVETPDAAYNEAQVGKAQNNYFLTKE